MVIDKTTDTEFRLSVRSLLGIDRNDTITLPDEDIDDISTLDMAEMEVLKLLHSTVDITDKRVKMAVIYFIAALLCPSMPARVEIEVKGIDSGWKKKALNYNELAEKLIGQAITVLDPLIDLSTDAGIFKIAPSKRAVADLETS